MSEQPDIVTEEDLESQPPVVYPEEPTCYNRWGHRDSEADRYNGQYWCVDCAVDFGVITPPEEDASIDK